jgi:hypothetical protein
VRGYFRQKGAEFGKDGVVAVRAIEDLTAEDGTHDEAGVG